MLLTLTTTHKPATDLGYLLHKQPGRVQEIDISAGKCLMFYPEANEQKCTFALMLDVDPVALVRGKSQGASGLLDNYVNDRPYAASSFMSVAIARALNTAFAGRSKQRQDLADKEIPLEAMVTPLPVRGGPALVNRLFEPLGYRVEIETHLLDETDKDHGPAPYVTLKLAADKRLQDVLEHLYVLVPVLDNRKHYWVGEQELEHLLRKGKDWLKHHPERDLIARRYLKHRGNLTREALRRLREDAGPDDELEADAQNAAEDRLERPIRLHDLRLDAVAEALKQAGARRVLDLGCGEGRLLRRLLKEKQFEKIAGADISIRALEIASSRLKLDQMAEHKRQRIELFQAALTYRDKRFSGFDAIALVEVIEHLDEDRLPALERVIFGDAGPKTVIVTTPNGEYNALFEGLAPGAMRHPDHRFEWSRPAFKAWAEKVAKAHGYNSVISPLGEVDEKLGGPSQMAVFSR
jgi:3' terminal RNA ribose 2'-O-methyltransferase Hen1